MWILFDLDDTLVETSKCLTPHALRRAHEKMALPGEFEELLALNEVSLTSKGAVYSFWKKWSEDLQLLEKGYAALLEPISEEVPLDPVEGALELLDVLSQEMPLVLVTMGDERLQLQKMKKAGIQPDRFSKLVVGRGPSKKSDYQRVIAQLGLLPYEGIACGDRVPLDLTPAKELGMTTVHFANGRGRHHVEPQSDVDCTIKNLNELTQGMLKA